MLNKAIPDLLFDLRSAGDAFEGIKQMGLSGASPLGGVKTKAPNSDNHNHRDAPPVAARQAEVARDYLKRAERADELNGHPPGSDGPMATAPKRYKGGRVLVFVAGAFAEMSDDVSRICDIIAHESRTTTTMPSAPRACTGSTSRRPGGTRRTAAGPAPSSTAPGTSSSTARRTAAPTARRCRRTRTTRTATSFSTTPRGGATPLPRRAQPLLLLLRSNPPPHWEQTCPTCTTH